MTIDLTGIPALDPQADELRELDRLMGEAFQPDKRARAALIPLLREYARLSRELHRQVSALRAHETDRFDQAVARLAAAHGFDTEFSVIDAGADLARVWELLDEVGECESTLTGRAGSCELLAAEIASRQHVDLTDGERHALELRRLSQERGDACRMLGRAKTDYATLHDRLLKGGKNPDEESAVLSDLLDAVQRYRQAQKTIKRLDERIWKLEEDDYAG